MVSWAALEGVLPADAGKWAFPSTQNWWGHTWSVGSSSGLPSTRDKWICWREHSKWFLKWLTIWSISHTGKSSKNWDFSDWRREGSGGTSFMCTNNWRESTRRMEPGSFQWCPVTRPETVGTKWNSLVPCEIKKHFCTAKVTEHWHRHLHKEAVKYPFLEILKIHLNRSLGKWLWVGLLEQ